MKFVVTLTFCICLLLVVAQMFTRNPFITPLLVLDGVTVFLGICTLVVHVPSPCKDKRYAQVQSVEPDEV